MVVYIEYVILDNFIIDFIILYSTAKILKQNIKLFRLFLSSLLGVIFAFLTSYINIHNALLFIIKLIMGIILVYTAFKWTKTKKFFLAYFVFLFLTFLLGGICYGLQGFLQSIQIKDGAITYSADFPVSLIIVAIFMFFILGKNLYESIKSKKKYTRIIITFQGNTLSLNALIDSGNQLIDNKTKLPISFLDKKDFFNKFGYVDFKKELSYQNLLCKAITGTQLLDTILVDKIVILDKHITLINARIALYEFDAKQDFKAIISESIIN